MSRMRELPIIKMLTGVLFVVWPFVIWLGLTQNSLQWLLPVLIVLFLLRLQQANQKAGPMRYAVQTVAAAGVLLSAASFLLKSHELLLFYPVVINSTMLAVFGGSLWTNMPIIERLARLQEPNLPPEGVLYTRRVTQVWCVFFVFNGSIALATALYADIQLWTVWNGIISYVLMGVLMGGELLVRRYMMSKETPE